MVNVVLLTAFCLSMAPNLNGSLRFFSSIENPRDTHFDNCFLEEKQNNGLENTMDLADDPTFFTNTHFSMTKYFGHLSDYSPKNNCGSCGFVSLIQVMSYYDTFYNDYIIDEFFDRYSTNINTLPQAYLKSPGVERNEFTPTDRDDEILTTQEYYLFCHNNFINDFQCYLTCINNSIHLTDNQNSFSSSIGCWDYQTLLTSYFSSSTSCVVSTSTNLSQAEYISSIKSFIDVGKPVIVHIKGYDFEENKMRRHSVVAYKYDDNNIYANFGWESNSTSYPLINCSQHLYTEIYYMAVLDFSNMGHYHSNNYLINGTGYCGCNPYNIS